MTITYSAFKSNRHTCTNLGMLIAFSVLCLTSCKKEIITKDAAPSVVTVPGSPELHDFSVNLVSRTTSTADVSWTSAGDYQSDSVLYTLLLNGIAVATNVKVPEYQFSGLTPATEYHLQINASVPGRNSLQSSLDFATDDGYTKFQTSLYPNMTPYDVAISPVNGYLVSVYNGMRHDLILSRVDSTGSEIWSKLFTYDGSATKIKTVEDGYVIMGFHYVLKIDFDGNQLWYKTFEEQNPVFVSVTEAANGDILIAGDDNNATPGQYKKALVTRMSATGTVLWQKTYGATVPGDAKDIVSTGDGGFYVLGSQELDPSATFQDAQYWLFKIDDGGAMIWENVFGDDTYDFPVQLKKINNNLIVAGYGLLSLGGSSQMQVFRLDLSGAILNKFAVKDPGFYDHLQAMETTSDGGYIICGSVSQGADSYLLGLFKYDPSDHLTWSKIYTGKDFTYWTTARAIRQTADNGYIIPATEFQNFSSGAPADLWLLKTNPTGSYD